MKPLTKDQINAVINWMNEWDQLKDTAIPIRFEEHFRESKKQEPWFSPHKPNDISKMVLIFDEVSSAGIRITKGKVYKIECLLIYDNGDHSVKINDDSGSLKEIREYSNIYITRMM